MATTMPRIAATTSIDAGPPILRSGALAYCLSGALALVAVTSALLTFLLPGILRGTAVMNGSARGTALVIVLIAVPMLVWSLVLAWRGSARAVLAWLGATAVLAYNALMFLFATPVNRLFPLNLAMLSLSGFSIAAVVARTDARALASRFSARVPVRGIASYVWVVVALNTVLWLAKIVPGLASRGAPDYLRGTGLTTNVVFVQDLTLWLPLMAIAAAWLWRHRPAGYLIVGAGLIMWVIESACVAADQWYGHAADPVSQVASGALVPVFAALALIGLVPVYYLLRGFDTGLSPGTAASLIPQATRRGWPAWLLTGIALFLTAGALFGGTQLMRDGLGMPLRWLSNTPFTSWTLPGLALLIGVAVPQLIVVLLTVMARRLALAASYLAGFALIAWIAIQLLVLQRYFFLQPVIAGFGVAEILLARAWQRTVRPPGVSRAGRGTRASAVSQAPSRRRRRTAASCR